MTELEMTSLLLKLADLSVTGIALSYDGGGDSGAIENIVYTTEVCESSEDVASIIDDVWSGTSLATLDEQSYDDIHDYAHKILDDIDDWWNDEGGFGAMYIQVPSGDYHIDNNIRIIHTEFYEHNGNMRDKTEE